MKNILADIKAGSFKPVYLLYGSEDYLKKQFRDKLKNAVVADGDTMNYSYFEGKAPDSKAVAEIADTMPFFADRRLVVIENSQLFKTADDMIVELVKNIPETTVIVFVENEVDKRSRLYKAVKEKGYICELNEQSDSDIIKWVVSILKREGKVMDNAAIQLFLTKTGSSMENISRELEKLICYTMGRERISSEDVEEVCTTQTTNRIFDMITAISQKNQDKALALYYDLLTLKEPPMRIMYLIARNFNQLLMIKELTENGNASAAIASKMGIQGFLVGKLQAQARPFKVGMLRRALEECVTLEEAVKTGRLEDRLAVEMLIVKYSAA